jgi:hypothetical protein
MTPQRSIWRAHANRAPAYRALLVAVVLLLARGTSSACVGAACMQIWSTADAGGALTVQWDFSQKVQTFESFCTMDRSTCLYSTIDPGFMAPADDVPGEGYYRLLDGTRVRIEIVSIEAGLSLNVNGQKLSKPGDSALLGTMPTIHNHPSWQLLVPGEQFGDRSLAYKLTTDSPAYADSRVFDVVITNVEPTPNGSPTPTPTPAPPASPCPGDCAADGEVTIDDLLRCVGIALGSIDPSSCTAADVSMDGTVTIDELLAAVDAGLNGCPGPPLVTFDEIQAGILTPSCATATCHDARSATANLVLEDGVSYGQLVGIAPDTLSARTAGLLRVDPGHPENSFLLVKLLGPPPGQGSRMPLTGDPLTAEEIDLIRNWILQGAPQ